MAMLKSAGARTQLCLTPDVVWRRPEKFWPIDGFGARVLVESRDKVYESIWYASTT